MLAIALLRLSWRPVGRFVGAAPVRGRTQCAPPIDKPKFFHEGVHTQIKRAYELSVCLKGRRLYSPNIASVGVPGSLGLCSVVVPEDSSLVGSDVYSSASIPWRSVDDLRR
jgi:hypothetical protein